MSARVPLNTLIMPPGRKQMQFQDLIWPVFALATAFALFFSPSRFNSGHVVSN